MHELNHGVVQCDVEAGEDWHEGWSQCVEWFLRFPDIEDLDLTVGLEGDVRGAPLRSSLTGCGQLLDGLGVFIRGEA